MLDLWNHIVADFSNIGSPAALAAFIQVLMIDITLAGDNAIVVGALAAGRSPVRSVEHRPRRACHPPRI